MKRLVLLTIAACSVSHKHAPDDGGLAGDGGSGGSGALETTITNGPTQFSPTSAAEFDFTSTAATATFMCSIDGEPQAPCTAPYSRTLADGPHAFSVRAIDPSGQVDDTPAEWLWTIDTVPPDTFLISGPPPLDNSVTVQFEFGSHEDNVTFECALDTAGYRICTSGETFGPVGDGQHTFSVRAKDRAGNVDPSSATEVWTVNTSTPDTQIDSGPNGPTASTTATFTFFSPNAGGGATFECSLDGVPFAPCSSPVTETGLAEAPHTFSVRVRDAAGTVDPTPATRTWTVELTPPETTIVSGPTGTVAMASASFTFTSSKAGSTFECDLDDAGFAACTSPFVAMMLEQGPHSFAVRATDAAGNVDPTPATRSWTIDTVPPAVTITGGPAEGGTSGPRVTFTFSVSEGTVACSVDSAAFTPCASPMAFNAPDGAHTFRVSATDAAGNTAMATRSWTVVCTAPDTTGAAGLLHFDDGSGQTCSNAVAGGAAAVLGDTTAAEPADPTWSASGRFGGDLVLSAADADHVTWPAMLGATNAFSVELWLRPGAPAGARDVLASGDSRFAIRSTAATPSTVEISVAVVGNGGERAVASAPVAAAAWHYVLATLSNGSLRLWVDGVRVERDDINLGTALAFDSLVLGGSYDGSIDEVWVAQTAIVSDDDALGRYCPAP